MSVQEYVVGTGEGAHFVTISEALEKVGPGDVLTLQIGLYEELIKVPQDVTIAAAEPSPEEEDAETTVLGGIITLANVTLRNIQVRGQVDVRKGHAIVEGCDIHHGNDGIRVGDKAKLTLRSSRVHHVTAGGCGVYFMPNSSGEISDTDIYECRVNGVHADGASVVLRDSRIRDCSFGAFYSSKADGLITNNTFEHMAKFGIYVVEESDPVVRSNMARECGVLCAYVSKGGKGLWTENTFEGSVHFLAGCEAKLGENRVTERAEYEMEAAAAGTVTAA